MSNKYTLWYCYDNTDWRIWGRYEHEHLAEKAREELKLHERPFDPNLLQNWESYLWTVILQPNEDTPRNMIDMMDHCSFNELLLDEKRSSNFGEGILDDC